MATTTGNLSAERRVVMAICEKCKSSMVIIKNFGISLYGKKEKKQTKEIPDSWKNKITSKFERVE